MPPRKIKVLIFISDFAGHESRLFPGLQLQENIRRNLFFFRIRYFIQKLLRSYESHLNHLSSFLMGGEERFCSILGSPQPLEVINQFKCSFFFF